ncbi:hypothetical protein MTO96_048374 [Rhipicephalus appendiculatus]
MGYYLIQIYIPASLIVVISWVSFWLHRNATPARVSLGVTTVLTMTTLMSSTNAALPKISYVKSIDIYLGTCFVMVFASLLEYATVGYLGKRIAMRKARCQQLAKLAEEHRQKRANAASAGEAGSEPLLASPEVPVVKTVMYIPAGLIVVTSWVSFWLHRNASPARVALGVTTVLTMTTLMSSTNAALPKISYVKSIDVYLGTCFVMVFAALLEYATVGYLGKRITMKKTAKQQLAKLAQEHASRNAPPPTSEPEPEPAMVSPELPVPKMAALPAIKGNYSRLVCEIRFARSMGYYLIQIYIPAGLIVVISWVSFWLHRNASPARVALGVTTVLTMTTLMSSTNAALPKISYVKSIDVYLGTCFVMVFTALLEYATVGYLGKRITMRKTRCQQLAKLAEQHRQRCAAASSNEPSSEPLLASPEVSIVKTVSVHCLADINFFFRTPSRNYVTLEWKPPGGAAMLVAVRMNASILTTGFPIDGSYYDFASVPHYRRFYNVLRVPVKFVLLRWHPKDNRGKHHQPDLPWVAEAQTNVALVSRVHVRSAPLRSPHKLNNRLLHQGYLWKAPEV